MPIYKHQQLGLNQFAFVVDGKKYSYRVIGATSYRHLDNSDVIDDSNMVQVPSNLFSHFKSADNIQVILSTNQGEISHAMLRNGTQSQAYRLFLRAY